MKLLIGIATYQRLEKLQRCLSSIMVNTHRPGAPQAKIVIVSDDNDKTANALIGMDHKFTTEDILVQPSRKYVIGAWNRVVQENIDKEWDGFIGLCDDVELFPNCLESVAQEMHIRFSDTDGVIGISQECPGRFDYTYKPYGQTLMGRKFVESYKEAAYQICCPFYTHFYQDEEMWQYASSLGKTCHSVNARLNHYHPGFKPEEKDDTHFIVRTNGLQQQDTTIFKRRQAEGKLWGRSWEL